jgi:universal stress protein A
MKINRILVPTDFSQESIEALKRAIDHGREHDSEIVLVHVIEPLPYAFGRWSDPTELLERSAEHGRDCLERFTQMARDLYPKCRGELHFGVCHEVISLVAEKLGVDLIVVATRSRPGFLGKILGGLAERLVRHAHCPVLTLQVCCGGAEIPVRLAA